VGAFRHTEENQCFVNKVLLGFKHASGGLTSGLLLEPQKKKVQK